MKFNILAFILSIFTTYHYNAQSTKLFEIEKLGWSINLPNDFSDMEQTKKQVQIVEAKNKIEIDKKKEKTEKQIEVKFQGKNYTFFMVFYEKNKSTDKIIQIETVNKNNEQLIESLKKTKSEAKFTKQISEEKIDGIKFYKTYIKMDLENNISQNFIIYNSTIKGYNTNFIIFYIKETPELKELLNAFSNSKFKE
ncbi:hypothetical protein P2W68_12855 [Chryseobacterium arthrosphaerae]|uniref:hypothetical protein n=1 Tax=Chryseobacterium arthrosphaerae TaxID=651561 RepID=UPI0023E1245E|nr:hypothetical protein [Chryseobacterium arthrosphaerae]WES95748.1 hypothetical protein P2W68_12855 [Chryseobacterium arthrosphaerae]